MAKALVFINSKSNTSALVKDLENVHGVSEAHSSRGLYDAVVMVEADSFGKLNDIVAHEIRNHEKVKATLTLTVIEAPASV